MIERIKKLLTDSCILFTVFVFILYIVGNVLVSKTITITLGTAALLFVCCIMLCLFHGILYVKKIHIALRIILHYLLVLAAAYLGFAIIGKIVSNSLETLVMLSLVTFIYSVLALILFIVSDKKKEEQKGTYTSIFKK